MSLYPDSDETMHVLSIFLDKQNYYVNETNKLPLDDKWINRFFHVPSLLSFIRHIYMANNLAVPDEPTKNKPLPCMVINGCVGKGVERFCLKTIDHSCFITL